MGRSLLTAPSDTYQPHNLISILLPVILTSLDDFFRLSEVRLYRSNCNTLCGCWFAWASIA